MDILISSNLERLLYYISGCDNSYIVKLMKDLKETGRFEVTGEVLDKIKDKFQAGFADDEQTKETIKAIYEKDNYLLDTHTAVAYKVLLDNLDNEHASIVYQQRLHTNLLKVSTLLYSKLKVKMSLL